MATGHRTLCHCLCHGGLVVALDIDGVLAPQLNPEYGPALLDVARDLNAELVWATGWNHHANRWAGPAIGLPHLLVIDMTGAEPTRDGTHWKVPYIAAWTAARPLVWLDDEFEAPDFDWAADRTATLAPTLLVPVDERTGLNQGHVAAVRAWAGLAENRDVMDRAEFARRFPNEDT